MSEQQQRVYDDIQAIVSVLRPEERECFRNLPPERLILLHQTLGRVLRNGFRSGRYPWLFTHCDELESPETRSFDSISSAAIKLIWEHIRDETNDA